jgi:diguanylate cyclase (GGDEF)-like protein
MEVRPRIEPRGDEPALLVESLACPLGELVPLGREIALEAGAALWSAGEPAQEIAVLLEGRLEVVRQAATETIALRQIFPGAVAAETSVLDDQPRFTTVRALQASRVLLVPVARFREFLRRQPELLERLFWLQVRRTRGLPWRPSRSRSVVDAETGLYDQEFFRERLVAELERAQLTGDTVVAALFAIDDFEVYSAARGRAAGDLVIRKVAEILRKTGRRGDLAARYADTEFATLLYAATASDGWRFAEAFRGAVMATGFPGEPGHPPERITISGGVAGFPLDAQDELTLLDAARARRDVARRAGGNCTVGPGARTK